MSLLLDALNKTEHDDDLTNSDVPNIHSLREQTTVATGSNFGKIVSIAIIALLASIVGLLMLLLVLNKPPQSNSAPTQTPATVEHQKVSLAEPTPAPMALLPVSLPSTDTAIKARVNHLTPPSKGINAQHVDSDIAALYTKTDALTVIGPRTPTTPKTTNIEPDSTLKQRNLTSAVSEQDKALAQALWDASEIQEHTPIPKGVQAIKPQKPKPPKSAPIEHAVVDAPPEDTMSAYDDTPYLHELANFLRNEIPSLRYSNHSYEKGYVILNRQTLKVGEETQSGVRVQKVLADGAILSFGENAFKLAALSSWVNI